MINSIKKIIKKSNLFKIFRPVFVCMWKVKGGGIRPYYFVKQQVVINYAKKFGINIFIETGTYYGDMIDAIRNNFKKIYSIELDNGLFQLAQEKYSKLKHIQIINGDSADKLKDILLEINEPSLFWLDGHYSGPGTAKGSLETPLLKELNLIFNHSIQNHVILIDDARQFGTSDYPSVGELKKIISNYSGYVWKIEDDLVRIYNKNFILNNN